MPIHGIYMTHRHAYPIQHNLTNTIITFAVVRQSSVRSQSTSRSSGIFYRSPGISLNQETNLISAMNIFHR